MVSVTFYWQIIFTVFYSLQWLNTKKTIDCKRARRLQSKSGTETDRSEQGWEKAGMSASGCKKKKSPLHYETPSCASIAAKKYPKVSVHAMVYIYRWYFASKLWHLFVLGAVSQVLLNITWPAPNSASHKTDGESPNSDHRRRHSYRRASDPRNEWSLGRVFSVKVGQDGLVGPKVSTSAYTWSGTLTCSIAKVCFLKGSGDN